jgi:uncharacterized protein (TIGR02996 family)
MVHGTSILSCLFSLDGSNILVAGGGRIPGCDDAIRIWEAKTGRELMILNGHVCGIYQLALDPRTGFLASASEDFSVFLWNLELRDAIFLVGGDPIVKGHVAFTPKATFIAIGETEAFEDFSSSIFVIDLNTGNEVFRHQLKKDDSISSMAINSAGSLLFFAVQSFHYGGDSCLFCCDISQGKTKWTKIFRSTTLSELHFFHDEKSIAAAVMTTEETRDTLSGVFILNAESGEVRSSRLMQGIGCYVDIAPNGIELAAAYSEGGVELLRLPDLAPVKTLTGLDEKEYGYCSIQYSPDGKTIIAGSPMFSLPRQERSGQLRKFDVADCGFPPLPAYLSPSMPQSPPTTSAPPEEMLALIQAVKGDSENDAPRLALAAWLEQRGDPRGAFVRVQCDLAKMVPDDPRFAELKNLQKELLEKNEKNWVGPYAEFAEAWEWRRGLLHLQFKPKQFFSKPILSWLGEIASAWLEALTVYDVTAEEVIQIAGFPFLANLSSLSLSGRFGSQGMAALSASNYLTQLRDLHLGACDLGEAGSRILAGSALLNQLTALRLGGNKVGDEGVQALISSLRATRLTSLELPANHITEIGAREVAASPHLTRLTRLDLSNNCLGDAGVCALAASQHLASLKSLSLWFTAIGSEGAEALAKSPYLNLTDLDLTANGTLSKTYGAKSLRKRFVEKVRM